MIRKISSLQTLVSRFGIGATLHYMMIRALHALIGYKVYRCLAFSPSFFVPTVSEKPLEEGYTCREVTIDELIPYASDPSYDISASFLSEAKDRGYRCWGIFSHGVLASYSFASSVPTPIDKEFRVRFPEGWRYFFKVMTLPRWRGLKLHAMQQRVVIHALSKEAAGFMTLIQADNLPSLKAFTAMGFEVRQTFRIYGKRPALRWVQQKNPLKTGICIVEKLSD